MPLVSLRQVLDHAADYGYGVPAFNVNNLEQVQAILQAADATDSPVILQASAGARRYAGENFLQKLIEAAVKSYPHLLIVMHQDHGTTPQVCRSAMDMGFSSVMMDGSLREDGATPADYDYNVAVTREVVQLAHARGVSVEGELGCLGRLDTGVGEAEDGVGANRALDHDELLTDPQQARAFVAATQVDALAIAIGTSHGAYKFSSPPTGAVLAIDRVREIHQAIPETHLVLHGSSSVPQELLEEVRRYGGELKPTWGVPVEEIQRAIRYGVRKINIDTDLRLAMTAAIRRHFALHPAEFDPRGYLKPAIAAMRAVCEARYEAFGSAGQGSRLAPLPLEAMARRYAGRHLQPA
ncbi:fructose-bisphosphate aldolase [Andreprevotia lacus DSM 23236]|jgi:fructose-bisphosphate aldolase class II|uniref:Fructose-1,6-bisphosphate aldolase n=1 Tax=Andreprevotia lacus DSM 23236 TaxID=1121001 RepID=A0A1W1X4K0_9NEIS|nr:class II fructose-bisphosphate aldolase [Andreprevotia lacus]SMC18371.1 fructose-bisphosphate aldolase [Andreprevotia lacus DSM 23236]